MTQTVSTPVRLHEKATYKWLLDGLYASVFTSNVDTALRVARALEAGNVGVNCTSPFDSYELPFGGYKQSGIGRSKGSGAVLAWLEEKSIYIRQKVAPE